MTSPKYIVLTAGMFYVPVEKLPDALELARGGGTVYEKLGLSTALEQRLSDWHRRRYGEAFNLPGTVRKLLEEVGELAESLMDDHDDPRVANSIAEEAADVAIVLTHILRGTTGRSLAQAMEEKTAIIEQRTRAAL